MTMRVGSVGSPGISTALVPRPQSGRLRRNTGTAPDLAAVLELGGRLQSSQQNLAFDRKPQWHMFLKVG